MTITHASQKIETSIITVDPRDLVPLDTNARYMRSREWDQLVNNIKQDGKLTSVPTVCRAGTSPLTARGKKNADLYEIISGNHRVAASIAAGLEVIEALVIEVDLTRDEKIAIQLSHNSIVGQDDLSVLHGLYNELDFAFKQYSGIDDSCFEDLEQLDLPSLGAAGVDYQEVALMFLPEHADALTSSLEDIADRSKKQNKLFTVASLEDFNKFFDALIAVKEVLNIHNSATAIRAMVELASQRLTQLEESDPSE